MQLETYSDEERLVAEQAVLTYRAVVEAAETASHGHGMDAMETAILDHGRKHLRAMLRHAAGAHAEAQKKGPLPGDAAAGARRGSRAT